VTFIHYSGSVKVLKQSVQSFQSIPFTPTQGIVFQPTVSPYGLVLVTELDNPLPNVKCTSDNHEETIPTGVVIFNKLLQDQQANSSWTTV
jgi:hypothetical protein